MIFEKNSVGVNAEELSAGGSDALSVLKSADTLEVLAPAGGPETVIAAVRAGADAVYFGAPGFNARRNAENFGRAEMKEAIEFCRIRGVKTYLTLNTLIADGEMTAALEEARYAYNCGIDAVIVQDLGLARLLREHLPRLPLHASTQISVHSSEALPILKNLGFCRVVPAREMDKEALKVFCKKAKELDIEVEVFVHGALCMCLSGQCYLSAMLGGRSGNRGLCAQPCRLEFSVPGGTGNDLSLKDMSILEHIEELRKMGVTSLKIEGRMKRPEYVAAAVSVARATVDKTPVSADAKRLLSGIFSRSGHTDGYFTGDTSDMFGVRTSSDEKMSAELIKTAHELYRRDYQRVPIKIDFLLKQNEPVKITVADSDGNCATVLGDTPLIAEKRAVTVEQVRESFIKLGGTCYYLDDLKADIDDGLFISAGVLNSLRREAVLLLDEQRKRSLDRDFYEEITVEPKQKKEVKGTKTVAVFKSVDQIPQNVSLVDAVVLPVETDFSKPNLPKDVILIADIPRGIMHSQERIKNALVLAKQNGVKAAVAGNVAGITLAQSVGLPVIAGIGMNVFNSYSADSLKELGAAATVLSFELTADGIKNLQSDIPKGAVTYGRLPLMIFKNCPGKNGGGCKTCKGKAKLTDRKNKEFPVMCRGEFSEMYNSVPLWNFDRLSEMKVDFQLLLFTDEDSKRSEEVINAALSKKAPDCEYTRGLYYRGVQ